MGNKEWDNYLREILGDFKSEGGPSDWEEVARQYDAENISNSSTESLEDEMFKEKLSNYTPEDQVQGWDRIESSLDAAEAEFDHYVRARIHEFNPPKDPHSWQQFLSSFSKHKILRAKLIALKVFESVAVVLLLITILHMGHTGRLPRISSPDEELTQSETNQSNPILTGDNKSQKGQYVDLATTEDNVSNPLAQSIIAASPEVYQTKEKRTKTAHDSNEERLLTSDEIVETDFNKSEISNSLQDISDQGFITLPDETPSIPKDILLSPTSNISRSDEANQNTIHEVGEVISPENQESYITPSLASLSSKIESPSTNLILNPVFIAAVNKPVFEFGMLVQGDYNQLKLPGDRVYNNGEPVIFPLQGLTSPGYGAGFTLALAHPLWAVETGIIYNAKSFKPGREITIGGTSDNSNVEFDAIHMQLISIPLQFRYRFEPKGRLKVYALGGFGLHVITQSDIDVMVEYNFPSLNPGENPKNNPSLARTIRETERVSDDFREKAPFSSQSYISANVGLGLEYSLSERKTLFLQTAYQYQIPNLRFSNHNGKHLLSVSFQAGVRTPLGT